MNPVHTALSVSLLAVALASPLGAGPLFLSGEYSRDDNVSADSAAVDNGYVRVLRDTAACTAAHTPGYGTRVIVALTDLTIQSSRGMLRCRRGDAAVFPADESYTPPSGRFFEVAFKTDPPPLLAPEQWLEPVKNTVTYEDPQIRVFEERLDPGDERPLHSHPQRVVVRLNETRLTDPRFPVSNRPGAGVQVPNTARFAEPVVHVVRNIGTVPLFNVVIELKPPR